MNKVDIEKLLKFCILIELNLMTSCLTSKIQNSEKSGDYYTKSPNVKRSKSKKNVKLSIINEEETQLATST